MFNIVWTDPTRESVGQRRARKEFEKSKGKSTTQVPRDSAVRSSVYTRRISTNSSNDEYQKLECQKKSERTFGGLFSSRTLRRVTSINAKNCPSSPAVQPYSSSKWLRQRSSFFGIESISSGSQKHNSSKPGSIASSRNPMQASGRSSDIDLKTMRMESRAHLRLSIDRDFVSNLSNGDPSHSTLQNVCLRSNQHRSIEVPLTEPFLTNRNLKNFLNIEDLRSPVSRGTSNCAGSVHSSRPYTNRGIASAVFSKWTAPSSVYTRSTLRDHTPKAAVSGSCNTGNKHSSYVQQIEPSSFIYMNTQVTVAPRHSNDLEVLTSKTTISSQSRSSVGAKPLLTLPETPQNENIPQITRKQESNCHLPPLTAQIYDDEATLPVISFESPVSKDHPVDFRTSSRCGGSTTPTGWIQAFGPNNISQWKTPEEWGEEQGTSIMPEAKVNIENFLADEDTLPQQPTSVAPTLAEQFEAIQEAAQKMKTSSTHVAIEALTQEWGIERDASVYKEMEMVKKRWMLTSLYTIKEEEVDKYSATGMTMSRSRAQRVLCLFESPGMTSYVSATHPSKHIYHVTCRGSQLGEVYQNIISVQTPDISPLHIPVVEQGFGAVYIYSLPALLPMMEIPTALGRIYDCLAPGGILHLALIDPLPSSKRLGPRLREWLDNNLMKTLIAQSRCTNPSKMFRQWLMDTGLRGHGSIIATAKFPAVFPTEHKRLHQTKMTNFKIDQLSVISADVKDLSDTEAQTELRCLVGRLLWQQIWGKYVRAHKWWWEYPEIVQECIRYEIYWQYHLIEAVQG